MFEYKTTVRIHEVDAAGIVFFAHYFKYVQDALEELMEIKGLGVKRLLDPKVPYLLPVVHVEMDYKMPLLVGDKIIVKLDAEQTGNSSFTIHHEIYREDGQLAGVGKKVHASIDRRTGQKIPLPESIKALIQ